MSDPERQRSDTDFEPAKQRDVVVAQHEQHDGSQPTMGEARVGCVVTSEWPTPMPFFFASSSSPLEHLDDHSSRRSEDRRQPESPGSSMPLLAMCGSVKDTGERVGSHCDSASRLDRWQARWGRRRNQRRQAVLLETGRRAGSRDDQKHDQHPAHASARPGRFRKRGGSTRRSVAAKRIERKILERSGMIPGLSVVMRECLA